jgi:hypothetical protein
MKARETWMQGPFPEPLRRLPRPVQASGRVPEPVSTASEAPAPARASAACTPSIDPRSRRLPRRTAGRSTTWGNAPPKRDVERGIGSCGRTPEKPSQDDARRRAQRPGSAAENAGHYVRLEVGDRSGALLLRDLASAIVMGFIAQVREVRRPPPIPRPTPYPGAMAVPNRACCASSPRARRR